MREMDERIQSIRKDKDRKNFIIVTTSDVDFKDELLSLEGNQLKAIYYYGRMKDKSQKGNPPLFEILVNAKENKEVLKSKYGIG